MSDRERLTQRAASGPLGRAAGRTKEIFGAALGNYKLNWEGRLQQVQVEAVDREAVDRGKEAEETDAKAKLAIANAEIETERRERLSHTPPP
jgi:uncharacterized protein YjbJ (UPF0337 family)